MSTIEFRDVKPYRCDGCQRLVNVHPCPACEARRQRPCDPAAELAVEVANEQLKIAREAKKFPRTC
jgi:hypothetical protein